MSKPSAMFTPSRMKINVVELSERNPATSFKDAVLEAIGDIGGFIVLGSDVLVATYVKPRKTSGGILLPEKSIDEDRWQGKLGLVLKMGESAFKYSGQFAYEGTLPVVGDYVAFHTSDSREIGLRGVSCRTIDASLIRMIVPADDVDAIY